MSDTSDEVMHISLSRASVQGGGDYAWVLEMNGVESEFLSKTFNFGIDWIEAGWKICCCSVHSYVFREIGKRFVWD